MKNEMDYSNPATPLVNPSKMTDKEKIRQAFEKYYGMNRLWKNISFQDLYSAYENGYNSRDEALKKLKKNLDIAVEELVIIAEWKDAYPEDIFPPIGTDTYHLICKASGISVDRVSAHVLRKITAAYSEAANKTLKTIESNEDPS